MIIVVVVLFDYVEKIDDFTELHAPLNEVIFDYYLNFIPFFINQFSGLFTFIACSSSPRRWPTRPRSWRHALGRHVVPPPDVALFPRGADHRQPFADAEPLADTHFAAAHRQFRVAVHKTQAERQVQPPHRPPDRAGDFAYIRGYNDGSQQASFLALEEYYSGTMTRSLEAADVKFQPRDQTLDAPRYTKRRIRLAGHRRNSSSSATSTRSSNLNVAERGTSNSERPWNNRRTHTET